MYKISKNCSMTAYQVVTCCNWIYRYKVNALVDKAALWPAPSLWWINYYSMRDFSSLYRLVKTERTLFQSNRNELSAEWLWRYIWKKGHQCAHQKCNSYFCNIVQKQYNFHCSVPWKSRFHAQPLSCCVQNQPFRGTLENKCSLIMIRESWKNSTREVHFLSKAAGFWPEAFIKMSLFTGLVQCCSLVSFIVVHWCRQMFEQLFRRTFIFSLTFSKQLFFRTSLDGCFCALFMVCNHCECLNQCQLSY